MSPSVLALAESAPAKTGNAQLVSTLREFSQPWMDLNDKSVPVTGGTAVPTAQTLSTLTPADFEGRDDVPLTVQIGTGMTPTLPASQWLTVFASTNLYFHLSMAYAILRARGVQIGKTDVFAGGGL